MLIWLCAMHCEAKPVIDFYRLKKTAGQSAYDVYQSDDVACIVTGIGDLNMAAACAWTITYFNSPNLYLINLGIAGHKTKALGTVVMASEVYREGNSRALYPVSLIEPPFVSETIISQLVEQTEYHQHAVYDMEAYAFLHSCQRFPSVNKYHCIKVVSDNQDHPPTRNKARISELIAQNIRPIIDFASRL